MHRGGPPGFRSSGFRLAIFLVFLWAFALATVAGADDLAEIRQRGTIRHLGIPYANFVTGSGDGFDVELIRLFAEHLGLRYQYVETDWKRVVGDLSGRTVRVVGDDVEVTGTAPIRGDLVSNGYTMLPWREKVVAFSEPTFPTQVWLIARSDFPMKPIQPSGEIERDIEAVKSVLKGRTLLGVANSCLDPGLYNITAPATRIRLFEGRLDDVAPAVIKGVAELALLDLPDSLISMQKWPGKTKVIGPVSPPQRMATAFRKESPELRRAFNEFLKLCQRDGTYMRLVRKYYPYAADYSPAFFRDSMAQR